MRVDASVTPTTAGVPSERARIDVCENLPPRSVTNARARPTSRRAVTDGSSSSATTIEPDGMFRVSGARSSISARQHAPADVAHVDRALAQVGVGDLVERARELLDHLRHRRLRVDALVTHQRRDLVAERRVGQQQRLRREDVGLAGADLLADRRLQRQQILLGTGARGLETLELAGNLIGGDGAPRSCHAVRAGQHVSCAVSDARRDGCAFDHLPHHLRTAV